MGTFTKYIPITQYLPPDGKKLQAYLVRDKDIACMASAIIDAGNVFEAEVLTTGHVSLTIAGPDAEGEHTDLAITVCTNGPEVIENFDIMVKEFYNKNFLDQPLKMEANKP